MAIGKASGNSKNPWFKSIQMGYEIAIIIAGDWTLLDSNSRMFKNISGLSEWIEKM